jgi:hypothetical protein
MKEPDLGEGSSPRVVKQLEYNRRLDPVIKTVTKKVFNQPPSFGDIEASTGSKATLPHL